MHMYVDSLVGKPLRMYSMVISDTHAMNMVLKKYGQQAVARRPRRPGTDDHARVPTASLRTKILDTTTNNNNNNKISMMQRYGQSPDYDSILDFRGFYSGIIEMLRGGIPRPVGDLSENLSRAILAGIILVGRLGAHPPGPGACELRMKLAAPRNNNFE